MTHNIATPDTTQVIYGNQLMRVFDDDYTVRHSEVHITPALIEPVTVLATISMKDSVGDPFVVFRTLVQPLYPTVTQVIIDASYRGSGDAPSHDVWCSYIIMSAAPPKQESTA